MINILNVLSKTYTLVAAMHGIITLLKNKKIEFFL